MDNATVKDNIAKLRRASGITQTAMAEGIGVSRTAYRNIEQGKTRIISDNIGKIAELLETSTEELLIGYMPSEENSRKLLDVQTKYMAEKERLIKEYEAEIGRLQNQIRAQQECIDAQKETIRTKDEIIVMMRKNIQPEE